MDRMEGTHEGSIEVHGLLGALPGVAVSNAVVDREATVKRTVELPSMDQVEFDRRLDAEMSRLLSKDILTRRPALVSRRLGRDLQRRAAHP